MRDFQIHMANSGELQHTPGCVLVLCVVCWVWRQRGGRSHPACVHTVGGSKSTVYISQPREYLQEEVKLRQSMYWAVRWSREDFSWTERLSLVWSVWIYWRIRWRLPVDTVTVRTVLKTTGTQRMRRGSTAALSAGRASHRGLSCWHTPC